MQYRIHLIVGDKTKYLVALPHAGSKKPAPLCWDEEYERATVFDSLVDAQDVLDRVLDTGSGVGENAVPDPLRVIGLGLTPKESDVKGYLEIYSYFDGAIKREESHPYTGEVYHPFDGLAIPAGKLSSPKPTLSTRKVLV